MTCNERKNDIIMEELWLRYYNDTLFRHGLITETERNKMAVAIKERTSELVKKANSREVRSGEAGDLKENLLQGAGIDSRTGADQRAIR